jgi:hypothetical protein
MERADEQKRDPLLVLLQGQPRPAVPPFACDRVVTVYTSSDYPWVYDEMRRAENERRDLVLVVLRGQPWPTVSPVACGMGAALVVLELRGA